MEALEEIRKCKEERKYFLFSVFKSILPGREDNCSSMLRLLWILPTPAMLQPLKETKTLRPGS